MSEQQRPPSFDDFDARLAKARPEKKGGAGDADTVPQRLQFGSGLQAGIEVVAGVGAGLLVGWGLDRWLDTMPLFLIVFFMLGAAAGVLNAYRHLNRMHGKPHGS